MKNKNLFSLVMLAILGAWAIVLRMFDFPILPAAPFLKVDFSDLMVLIGMMIKGPIGAVAVALIRDSVNYMMKGGEAGLPIGTMMSFLASMAMFLPTHFILKHADRFKPTVRKVFMSVTLVLGLVLVMGLFNYFVALPIYVKVMNFPIPDITAYLLSVIIPFNLIKGVILSVGQLIVVEKIWPEIAKRNIEYEDYHLPINSSKVTI
uniref:ECF transporter S component n=1 Tax=Globicatella sulfidifaciens TaxID=136093 RepID=UPI0023F2ECA6|nr:ECF transporter S component [Globicatella sulfidifaciens]